MVLPGFTSFNLQPFPVAQMRLEGISFMSMHLNPPMRRVAASKYLLEKHGIERKPSTLAKLATIGGGPVFRLIGRIPVYDAADAYAAAITSPKVSSTSQLRRSLGCK
jgi:hypothetical protein